MDESEKTQVLQLADISMLQADKASGRKAYLIVIKGRSVGKMYPLDKPIIMLGRSGDVDIQIEDDGVSRKHAYIERAMNGHRVVDNQSTNGIFVNGQSEPSHDLEDGDRVQIGSNTILKFSYQDAVEESYQKQLYDSATRDGLTGAYNKKHFADRLKSEFAYCYRHDTLLSLILFDIDHFKKLNDGWGHPAGDYVLKNLAAVVEKALRTEDMFARYGGEEFGVILRDTDAERAFLIGERIRRAIEVFNFDWEGDRLPVQISVGVATLETKNYQSVKELVKASDAFLYKAKSGGRNRTESALVA